MENESINLTRWQRDRRAFIEHRVFWHGRVGLADLMNVMGLSRAQASKDLNSYINYHPGHIVYDKTAKTYVLGPKFKAQYAALDPSEYLGDLLSISRGASVPAADWVVTSLISWGRLYQEEAYARSQSETCYWPVNKVRRF